MGLVNELQESAERDDALTVLRKAKRVCAKLNRRDILEWVNLEQNGYFSVDEVPAYRVGPLTICYNTNGSVPAGFGYIKSGIFPIPGGEGMINGDIQEPLSTVLGWIIAIDKGDNIYVSVPKNAANILKQGFRTNMPEIIDQFTYLAQQNESIIRDIPEQVKNRVLDWACELDMAGIYGEGHVFSTIDQEKAGQVTFNFAGCNIGQLTNSGDNTKGV